MNPIVTAFEVEAQAQSTPITAAQWLWQQAGITASTNMKLGDMAKVIEFINGRIKTRANTIQSDVRTATSPYLWPFSDSNAAILYPTETKAERDELKAAQMLSATEVLRAFVLGDIFTQASDDRAVQYLGDSKVSGSKGEARLLLEALRNDAASALTALGARRDTQTDSGGMNMQVTTHFTAPTFPNG